VGEEITPSEYNHYIAFDIRDPVSGAGCIPQQVIDQVRSQGGFGFIAHPDHEGTKMFHVKPFPWKDWTVAGYTGIGIWDFMTDWQSSLLGCIRAVLSYYAPAFFLKGPRDVTLRRWDNLNREGRIVGIAELDNHHTKKTLFGKTLHIFPFRKAFRFLRTHVLTEQPFERNFQEDEQTLFKALKQGRVYIALEFFENAKGFSFIIESGKETATMGDELRWTPKAKLQVALPRRAQVRIIKDGVLFRDADAYEIDCPIREPGVYRIESSLKTFGKYRPWIFSNPVFLR
jgi:hypothetical protein